MRVTESMLWNSFLRNSGQALEKLQQSYQEVSSGNAISKPSDNPLGTYRALRFGDFASLADRHLQNANNAEVNLQAAENSISEVLSFLNQAKTLTLEGVNDTTSVEARNGIAQELDIIIDKILENANSKHIDKALFGGYETLTNPFVNNAGTIQYQGDGNSIKETVGINLSTEKTIPGNLIFQGNTAVGVTTISASTGLTIPPGGGYVNFTIADENNTSSTITLIEGNTYSQSDLLNLLDAAGLNIGTADSIADTVSIEASFNDNGHLVLTHLNQDPTIIPEITVTDLTPQNFTNSLRNTLGLTEGSYQGVDIFDTLQQIRDALYEDDAVAAHDYLEQLDASVNQVIKYYNLLGVCSEQLETTKNHLESYKLQQEDLASEDLNVDLSKAITDLLQRENAYQAALSAGSRIMQYSLMDFLG